MKERPETRLTVVFGDKRIFEKYNVTIVEDIQDDGRTLKLFVGCSHNNQQKKDDGVTLTTGNHLESRSTKEEDYTKSVKTDVVDNHADNPQDDPRKASGADNGDTGDGTFPADLKSKLDGYDS